MTDFRSADRKIVSEYQGRLVHMTLTCVPYYMCFWVIQMSCFWVMQMSYFVQKRTILYLNMTPRTMTFRVLEPATFGWPWLRRRWYHSPTSVFHFDNDDEFSLYIEATDYWSNFAKTIFFENGSCFPKIPFSISVRSPRMFQGYFKFDSRRSPSLANRRRSTSPIYFFSFAQSCDQHVRKIRTIRKSAARWRRRRARGYRNIILRANLLYVPYIKR